MLCPAELGLTRSTLSWLHIGYGPPNRTNSARTLGFHQHGEAARISWNLLSEQLVEDISPRLACSLRFQRSLGLIYVIAERRSCVARRCAS